MAITKIHPIKSTLNFAISYIVNGEKTDEQILVSTHKCHQETAHTQFLRTRNDVKWTYISPAGDFDFEAERKGDYQLAGEVFTVNAKGESKISYADYAIAMVDEAEKGNHINQRISVLWK